MLLAWWHGVASGIATAIKDQPGTVTVRRNPGNNRRIQGILTDLDGIQTVHSARIQRVRGRVDRQVIPQTFTPGATTAIAVFNTSPRSSATIFIFDYTDSNGVRSTVEGSAFV